MGRGVDGQSLDRWTGEEEEEDGGEGEDGGGRGGRAQQYEYSTSYSGVVAVIVCPRLFLNGLCYQLSGPPGEMGHFTAVSYI